MRVDKFLKVSRLIKRRTLAKEICDSGRVEVNERKAKASTEVNVGDSLTIRFGQRTLTVKIDKIVEQIRKENVLELYSVLQDEKRQGSRDMQYEDDKDDLDD